MLIRRSNSAKRKMRKAGYIASAEEKRVRKMLGI
jgi:ribosomal protein L35